MRRKIASTAAISLVLAAGAVAALDTTGAVVPVRKSTTLGQTYEIAEPDMRQEIERRAPAAQARMARDASRPLDSFSAFQSVKLPLAGETTVRQFDPTYTLPHDIRDGAGKVLFAKGTKVNAYDKVTMPGRFIVIGPYASHYEWLDTVVKPGDADIVLLASGNVAQVRKERGLKVYLLEERGVERLGLRAVPSIVQQSGRMLTVREFSLDESRDGGGDDDEQG